MSQVQLVAGSKWAGWGGVGWGSEMAGVFLFCICTVYLAHGFIQFISWNNVWGNIWMGLDFYCICVSHSWAGHVPETTDISCPYWSASPGKASGG